jgi:hypothetical protein
MMMGTVAVVVVVGIMGGGEDIREEGLFMGLLGGS